MKKMVLLAVALLLTCGLLSACIHIGVDRDRDGRGLNIRGNIESTRSIRGEGDLHRHDYTLDSYSKVVVGGGFNLICDDRASGELTIDIQDNLFDQLEVEVRNNTLYITSHASLNYDAGKTPTIFLSVAELTSLDLSGAADLECETQISGKSLSVEVSGAGDLDLWLDVDQLDIRGSGASDVSCRGRADTVTVQQSGASSADLAELTAKSAEVEISGVGSCAVNCSETLDVTVNGAGELTYYGSPKITQEINGMGIVHKGD